jgi:hypothetical protein
MCSYCNSPFKEENPQGNFYLKNDASIKLKMDDFFDPFEITS